MSDSKAGSFAALFEQTAEKPKRTRAVRVGDRVDAVVIKVGRDTVLVELEGKIQAFLESTDLREADGTMLVKEGERVHAHVVEVNKETGEIRLAKSLGKPGNLAGIEQARSARLPVDGKVIAVNKGGVEVEIGGLRAFCPMSQLDNKFVEDPKTFIGETLKFLVTEVRDGGKGVVLSRRAMLEQESAEAMKHIAGTLTIGATARGTITSVRDFGAFVDLGGVEGLIPRSEVSHDRGAQIGDLLKAGEIVEVQVRDLKEEPNPRSKTGAMQLKITLSLKAMSPAPERTEAARPQGPQVVVGSVVTGKVEKIETYGIFVQLDNTKGRGGRGLVPSAELGVPRGTDLRKSFPEGTVVVAKVLETGDGRLRLSIKGAKDAEERAQFEDAKSKSAAPASLGTFADLLKKAAKK
ncbi:MAG: S1 RNA-binding domain-containing protein [Polyangiaceae bacterium]